MGKLFANKTRQNIKSKPLWFRGFAAFHDRKRWPVERIRIWLKSIHDVIFLVGKWQRFSMAAGLTHWGRVTHICVVKITIIGSDNGLSPGRRQAIIWVNDGILLIGPLGTNFIEILIGIQTFSVKKMHLKMSSAKRRPFCLGLNVLNDWPIAAV